MAMNPEIKAKWLEDLRSGNFLKGQNALHTSIRESEKVVHRFCCLGVLCEQAVAAGVIERNESGFPNSNVYTYGVENTHTYLPEEVREWAGIETYSPRVSLPDGGIDNVAILNDDVYTEFGPIADLIEADSDFGDVKIC